MNFRIEDSFGFIINRTALKMKNELHKALESFDITPDQWIILLRLFYEDGISQKELAEKIYKDNPNTTRILDLLERKGLVKREADPLDRRAYRVYVTEKGREMAIKSTPVVQTILDRAAQGLDLKEIQRTNEILTKMFVNLEKN